MEKFYIVTEQSRLHKDYFEYKNNAKRIKELVNEFTDKHTIETHLYYPSNSGIAIVPTKNDKELFDKMLNKSVGEGLRFFKKNSKISKDWINLLDINNIKVINKPMVGFYIRGLLGKHRTRLFDVEGILYCSVDTDVQEINCPEGFTEIKASEFYKVIEENS